MKTIFLIAHRTIAPTQLPPRHRPRRHAFKSGGVQNAWIKSRPPWLGDIEFSNLISLKQPQMSSKKVLNDTQKKQFSLFKIKNIVTIMRN